ncbi:MAG: DegT/DnrJ/EryC1/StrS family aminotransferase [Clostridiales Family XIII bacterium]|jgi:dTDP-4-amino-4,6-dideoxygalactose transaminase|nr:DegT/DnrJ/EryC1/StrS family aminotransferase [Clostridiales Family XIII bacterium]
MTRREIPLSVPRLSEDIIENLSECVRTGWVSTGGRFIGEFEEAMAKYLCVEGAVGCQSGTAGLHVALRVMDVTQGDEVIVPTLTFIAAVNPIRYQGAEPVFMDCDAHFCLDPKKLEMFCAAECDMTERGLINKKTGKRIAAVIVVHVFGDLADMDNIMRVAEKYRLKVLEDATEALGSYYTEGRYKGRFAGTVGDMGVYSFNANKIITTGGGGMIVAKDAADMAEARYLAVTAKNDGLFFIHDDVGYNYRMLNIQAAFGVSQIRELEAFIGVKRRNYEAYRENISKMGINGIKLLAYRDGIRSNHWFYSFEIDAARDGMAEDESVRDRLPQGISAAGEASRNGTANAVGADAGLAEDESARDRLMRDLIGVGIQCRPVWRLCHKQKPYEKAQSFMIDQALRYEKTVLNLPCSTNLSVDDVAYICEAIKRFM